ncbi:unnamed protein product [Clonostachys rosea]|uniref:Uncharacterized protein n=1 Tax=Bionectria ochroleuca TaxID=29856 RepID=A0ABY6TT81_BIOOC|nr:unnamed protein product [Clonostachys rosea]
MGTAKCTLLRDVQLSQKRGGEQGTTDKSQREAAILFLKSPSVTTGDGAYEEACLGRRVKQTNVSHSYFKMRLGGCGCKVLPIRLYMTTTHIPEDNGAFVFDKPARGIPVVQENLIIREDSFDETSAPPLAGITAQTLYASLDPSMRLQMTPPEDAKVFFPYKPGQVITSTLLSTDTGLPQLVGGGPQAFGANRKRVRI